MGCRYAKVYEQTHFDPDTGFCDLHTVFAEATWDSPNAAPNGVTMTANLKSCGGVEYQQNTRGLGGLTHGSIDTPQSSRPDSGFVAYTGTSWGDSVATGCLPIR